MSEENNIKTKEFVIGKVIGTGAFSSVCIATLVKEGDNSQRKRIRIQDPDGTIPDEMAVKTPNDQISSKGQIKAEYEFYSKFYGCQYIPQVYSYDEDSGYLYMERLYDNLDKERNRHQFTPDDLKKIIGPMIAAVKEVHEHGYIHRDIKPENFARDRKRMIKIFDFGLSEEAPTKETHIVTSLTGTPRYASVRALKGENQSKRDDMEALLYVWLYLLKGKLPWQGKIQEGNNPYEKIIKEKENVELTIKKWINDCNNFHKDDEKELLENLNEYRKMIADLKFLQAPNYQDCQNIFNKIKIVPRRPESEPLEIIKKSQIPFFDEPFNIEQDTNAIKDVEIGECTEIYKYTDNLSNIPCFPPPIEDIRKLLNSKEIEDIPNSKEIEDIPNSEEIEDITNSEEIEDITLCPSPIIFAPTLCADFFKDGEEFKPYQYICYKESQNPNEKAIKEKENLGASQKQQHKIEKPRIIKISITRTDSNKLEITKPSNN